MLCGFSHYGDPLAEIGHIWGFWALSGKCVGVNVDLVIEDKIDSISISKLFIDFCEMSLGNTKTFLNELDTAKRTLTQF